MDWMMGWRGKNGSREMDWNVLKSPGGVRRARMGALEMELGARHTTKAHPQPLGHQHPDIQLSELEQCGWIP